MKDKRQVFRSLAMVTQLGISVMTPVFLCIFAGCWVDTHFKTKTLLFFVIIGVLAGGRCGWQMVKMTVAAGEKEDLQEQEAKKAAGKDRKKPQVTCPKRPSRVLGKREQAEASEGSAVFSDPESGRQEEKKGGETGHDG